MCLFFGLIIDENGLFLGLIIDEMDSVEIRKKLATALKVEIPERELKHVDKRTALRSVRNRPKIKPEIDLDFKQSSCDNVIPWDSRERLLVL